MRTQQVIGTRLVATVAMLLCFIVTSPQAQRGGGADAQAGQREA